MKKIAVIYGGKSTEHDISIKSSKYVLKNINREKYDVSEIYIDKKGNWFEGIDKNSIKNIIESLKKYDLVFPIMHGLYGEDGTIQGLLELIGIPYVGCKVLASSICMDKVYAKILFDRCNIKNAPSIYIKYISEDKFLFFSKEFIGKKCDIKELQNLIKENLKYPLFVKPSNSGSSIGVYKVKEENELKNALKSAAKYDSKILVEQGINGKEVEVAVLGNSIKGIEVSNVGEIISAENFYSFSSKYENKNSKIKIPANLTEKQTEKIRKLAKQAFIAVDGTGLSRIDFFVENETGEIYLNEINTLPGMTEISMYPMLMRNLGYNDEEILDKLIQEEDKIPIV